MTSPGAQADPTRGADAELLQRGLDELQLAATTAQVQQLLDYLDLLQRWNRRFNLTAVRERSLMVTRHLLDSLAVLPWLSGDRLIDVGSGAGLPGIPLAILQPDREFSLLDSNGKKTRFMTQACASLGLKNTRVAHARVEAYQPETAFDAVLSRAFASLGDMIASCRHLLNTDGVFLALKGQHPDEELATLASTHAEIELLDVVPLSIPDLDEERCLVRLIRSR